MKIVKKRVACCYVTDTFQPTGGSGNFENAARVIFGLTQDPVYL